MLIRLPPTLADQLRELARATRIRQSEYLREAVADLLAKYSHVQPARPRPRRGPAGGSPPRRERPLAPGGTAGRRGRRLAQKTGSG